MDREGGRAHDSDPFHLRTPDALALACMMERLFPIVMMAASTGAAIIYLYAGDFRRAIYWTAAAVITASVTF